MAPVSPYETYRLVGEVYVKGRMTLMGKSAAGTGVPTRSSWYPENLEYGDLTSSGRPGQVKSSSEKDEGRPSQERAKHEPRLQQGGQCGSSAEGGGKRAVRRGWPRRRGQATRPCWPR